MIESMNSKKSEQGASLLRLLYSHMLYSRGMELVSGEANEGFVLAKIRSTGALTFFRFLPTGGEDVLIQRRIYNTNKLLITETQILVNRENVFDRIANY